MACRLLALFLLGYSADAHGRMEQLRANGKTVFTRKGPGFEDSPTGLNDRFICRNAPKTPQVTITAGGTMDIRWEFGAAHLGDCAAYLSYGANKYFKIANFPECNLDNKNFVTVQLPAWLPNGVAVVRWDWYALHNYPGAELYAQCTDVTVAGSDGSVTVAELDPKSYSPLANGGIYPTRSGNNGLTYRAVRNRNAPFYMTGPACIGGVTGNCCDASEYVLGAGFANCKDTGTSPGGKGQVEETTCLAAAVKQYGDKVTAVRGGLVKGTRWSHVPTGCSVAASGDWAAHWNQKQGVVGDATAFKSVGAAPVPGAGSGGAGSGADAVVGAVTPAPTPEAQLCIMYTVKAGDTLSSIAQQYTELGCKVSAAGITDFNMVAQADNIDVGDTFTIPCPGNCCTDSTCGASALDEMLSKTQGQQALSAASSTNGKLSTAVGLLATTVVALLAFIYRSKRVEGGALMRAEAAVLSWMPSSGAATTPPLPTTKRMSQNPGNDSALNLKSAAGTI